MELIYAYVEDYRIFHQKEFRFLDKFRVEFDRENMKLKIERNPDYVDIYPDNIVGISAIVGKNASGKSSLLELIGNKNYDCIEKGNQYFLVYHEYINKIQEDVFILESNKLENYKCLLNCFPIPYHIPLEDESRQITGWIFKVNKGQNVYLADDFSTNNSRFSDLIEHDSSVISFRRHSRVNFSESDVLIPRRYAQMESESITSIVAFFTQGLLSDFAKDGMYNNDEYYLKLSYKSQTPVYVWKQRINNKTYNERNPIDRLLGYWSVMDTNLYEIGKSVQEDNIFLAEEILIADILRNILYDIIDPIFENQDSKNKALLTELAQRAPKEYPHFDFLSDGILYIIQFYSEQISFLQNSKNIYWTSRIQIETIVNDLRMLLKNMKVNVHSAPIGKIKGECYLPITVGMKTAHTHTNLSETKLDFHIIQDINIIRNSITSKIKPLSDGEEKILEFFTSIDEQISEIHHDKKKYILLFDEIERCMHPEMCRTLISDLIKFLKGYPNKEFQIIIASHSPFIVGDLRKENLICLGAGGSGSQILPENPFGQNIHTLLRSQFFLENTLSEYAVQTINLMVDCLTKESLADMRELIRKELDPNGKYPWKSLPQDDQQTLQYLQSVISSIGEPMIRNSLQDELDRWKRAHLSRLIKETELLRLQAQVAALEKELGEDG